MKNKTDKFDPLPDKEYVVTDMCFWKGLTEEEQANYNPYDKEKMPHGISLVDVETGTTVNLLSGSIIKVIKSKDHNPT